MIEGRNLATTMIKERENEEKRSVDPCAFETRRGVISGGCAGRGEKRRNRERREGAFLPSVRMELVSSSVAQGTLAYSRTPEME